MTDKSQEPGSSPFCHASDSRVEALARLIAAEKMNLLRDTLGRGLPDDLWKQAEPLAAAVMTLIRRLSLS